MQSPTKQRYHGPHLAATSARACLTCEKNENEQVVAKLKAAAQTGGQVGITARQEEVRRALMFP